MFESGGEMSAVFEGGGRGQVAVDGMSAVFEGGGRGQVAVV